MSPLSLPNFSPIQARIRVLWRILRSVQNEEEKIRQVILSRHRLHYFAGYFAGSRLYNT